jgi:hypothetical protein
LSNRASDLIEEEKLDETQAGLITLAAKAALEIHKQISKSTQSPATTGGVSGLKKVMSWVLVIEKCLQVEVYLSFALLFK